MKNFLPLALLFIILLSIWTIIIKYPFLVVIALCIMVLVVLIKTLRKKKE